MTWTRGPRDAPQPPKEPSKHGLVLPGQPRPHDPHGIGHFVAGVCVCPCAKCTVRATADQRRPGDYTVRCVCPDCSPVACGARTPVGGWT